MIVGVTMGLRPGELTGLSWRDVDMDAGVIHVRRTLKREKPAGHGRVEDEAVAAVA